MSMSGNQKQDNGFGRDDMAALLGGGLSERWMQPPVPVVAKANNKTLRKMEVADMSTQETAAWLLQQQQQKKGKQSTQRHRTTKVRKYHELLLEEQQNIQTAIKPSKEVKDLDDSDLDEGEGENEAQAVPAPAVTRRRRRPSTSSSSSDSSAPRRRPRQDSNSSDSDSEEESRRRRLLQRRKEIQQLPSPANDMDQQAREPAAPSRNVAPLPKVTESDQRQNQRQPQSSSSSSSSDSSSEESSSEEEVRAKPIFVPRHKRGVIQSVDDRAEQEEALESKRKQQEEKRMKESRAMVQKVLLDASKHVGSNDDAFEGITGARNPVPDDEDLDNEQEIDEWEVRELERLVSELDIERLRLEEVKERERRRNMTDEELMREKIEPGNFNSRGEDLRRGGQRYFHRGAFYMDESEWDESDVRHKADEYAAAATGEDKIDKKSLPKVMQVKNFGRANQNLKYQGLAAEDTTDKQIKILPILGSKRKQNQL